MLVTTVVSLAVAAVGLLGPLQQELRNSAKQTLQKDLRGATSPFKRLDLTAAPDYALPAGSLKSIAERVRGAILYQQRALSERVGASRVTLLGYHDLSGHGYAVAPTPDSDQDTDPYDDVPTAFLNGQAALQLRFDQRDGVRARGAPVPERWAEVRARGS